MSAGRQVYAKDCAECTEEVSSGKGRIDRFKRTVRLDGDDLTAEHRFGRL